MEVSDSTLDISPGNTVPQYSLGSFVSRLSIEDSAASNIQTIITGLVNKDTEERNKTTPGFVQSRVKSSLPTRI